LRIKRSILEKFMTFYPTHRYGDSHPVPEARLEQVEFFTAGVNREKELLLLKEIDALIDTQNGSGVDLKSLKPKFDDLKGMRDFIGEDYTFSNRLRAMGIPLFIYPNATISHFGVNHWTGNYDTFLKAQQEAQDKAAASASEKAQP
jgi:hypothetical protein